MLFNVPLIVVLLIYLQEVLYKERGKHPREAMFYTVSYIYTLYTVATS